MLGGMASVCEDAMLTGSDRMAPDLALVSRMESRIPGFRTRGFGNS